MKSRIRKLCVFAGAAAIAALATAIPAQAALPTDPQGASEQPLRIMRVGETLDRLAKPLADVKVATLDTGIDLQHPDLAPRILPPLLGSDLIGNAPPCTKGTGAEVPDNDPDDPLGCSGHGTAVSGIIGAAWNNGIGGAGVAPNALFIPMRTCWDESLCYGYNDANAVNKAAAAGARVVSFSDLVGSPLETGFRDAIANHPQLLFVAIPSGNDGPQDADASDPQPCNAPLPNLICVSTSSPVDGLDCGYYGANTVDIAVPTQNSITTYNGAGSGPTFCATSFAAPTLAGVATLLFGVSPGASGAEIKAAIMGGARRVPAWQGKSVTGGVADVEASAQILGGLLPEKKPAKCAKRKKKKKKKAKKCSKKRKAKKKRKKK